jgi:hypothetical protein
MSVARVSYRLLVWIYLPLIVIQFFLAGLFVLGGKSSNAHVAFGDTAMTLVPIVMLLLAFGGRMGRMIISMTVVLLLLVLLQSVWVHIHPMWLRALHPVGALLIAFISFHIAQRIGRPDKTSAGA